MSETQTASARWNNANPTLTVLIPFLRDDPCALIAALEHQVRDRADAVEAVLLDDGTGDDVLAHRVEQAVRGSSLPARFVRSSVNLGRAKGRNRLAQAARGRWLLFLDSDMLPDSPLFLQTYLELIEKDAPAVAFGGFSLDQAPRRREHALHRQMALASDCAPVEARCKAPEKHVFTSNLLVRRDVFDSEAFDESFSGWGWEDVEWAMRVTRRHPILHIANTATHLGLDAAPAMARKYEQSAANFARVVSGHREIVSAYPSYRAARALKRLPLRGLWRPLLKAFALTEAAPLASRALAMRLYRAALYAEAV
ncbi:polysaccharide biosynthesis protein HfsG [Phenylobacterium montanum]|uniref:Glycosyltransferase n=1 Tax=Phenylobacterium montanum TaxID=2823693 RepID=A0A975G190_9CAUL|nr:glycosyltransferase [Caulobacter sp. S6]QUD88632.1 glycosyltransferase [Caulobacter sp. S6]